MAQKSKKMAVLRYLSQATEPVSLKNLIEKLGKEYNERTVRRWLQEMIQDGLIEKQGEKRGTQYQLAQGGKKNSLPTHSCFGTKSRTILASIKRPIYERTPVTYIDNWFEVYEPNQSFYIPQKERDQLHKAGIRSKGKDPAGTYAHQIFNRLLIDLSYNSSRLEGNTYSLLDTQKLLLEGTGVEGKLDEEKIMILNHKEAIRYLVDTAPKLQVNREAICTLHYLLADGLVEADDAGKARSHAVRIGGSTYIPLEDPQHLQERLERITKKAALIEDPYEQSLFLLIHVSYLQAFSDVNKRTARLSANIPLIKNNLVPLSFNDVERDDYTAAMIAIYELQEAQPILDLYLFSYMRTCALYDSTVKSLGFDEIRVRYRHYRKEILRHIILNCMSGKPMKKYISSKMELWIKPEDRASFFEDILEDLRDIDLSRSAGLGITPQELAGWAKSQTGRGK